jgi:iron complex transport system substrate-binding protein
MHAISFRRVGALILASTLLALAACGSTTTLPAASREKPLIATDAIGNAIVIPATAPQRIVSLGATDSEILGALISPNRVIGVDISTDYPADLAAKPKVTDSNGTPNVEAIVGMQPDLVLGFGGEDATAEKQLVQLGIRVVDLPATNLDGSLTEIRLVGQLVHAEAAANALASSMQQQIAAVEQKVAGAPNVSVYMEVGYTPPPPYAFGGGSFGDQMIAVAGGTNIFAGDTANGGYPQVSDEAIIAANPQVIVLTEDPAYGGDPSAVAQRPGWSVIRAVKNGRIYTINPDLVQRPGPRIVQGLQQLARDLHPDLFP